MWYRQKRRERTREVCADKAEFRLLLFTFSGSEGHQ